MSINSIEQNPEVKDKEASNNHLQSWNSEIFDLLYNQEKILERFIASEVEEARVIAKTEFASKLKSLYYILPEANKDVEFVKAATDAKYADLLFAKYGI